jgi:ubiquinone/menaquinone biosynthesis C-methylase UbiE
MIPARVPEADATSGAIRGGEELDLVAYSRAARKFIGREYRRLNEFIVAELRLNPRGRILEIGPGPGWIGILLAKQLPGSEIVGLELSPDMIRIAEQNRAVEEVENVRFVQGDAADLSKFEAASFDGVVSNGSLHHWLDPVVVFDEVARVLKPGGVLAINDNRRDMGLGGRALVGVITAGMRFERDAAALRTGWRSSIAAAYTEAEVRAMLERSRLAECSVKTSPLDLLIHSPHGAPASGRR